MFVRPHFVFLFQYWYILVVESYYFGYIDTVLCVQANCFVFKNNFHNSINVGEGD